MNRVFQFVIIELLLFSILASSSDIEGEKNVSVSNFKTIFSDNFEGYAVGTFPFAGGWELWFNGAGDAYQVVTENVSVSPTKSLQLLGAPGWAADAIKRFATNSPKVGFQVNIRVEEVGVGPSGWLYDSARVAFAKKTSSLTSREYAPIFFQDNGTVVTGGQILQSYAAGTWYKVKLIIDRPNEKYSVWIDDALRAENLNVTTCPWPPETDHPSYEFEAFSVSQCYNEVKIYVDDAEVFAEELPPAQINEINMLPTCPAPYVPSNETRINEPVTVKANVTNAERVALKFRRQNEQWFNVSMVYNVTEGLWVQTMPGQCENSTVEFFVEAWNIYGINVRSPVYSFNVKPLLPGDIDGSGAVDIYDAIVLSSNFEG